MEEKNELNDIILNKNNGANNNKKIILSVATLGVILIIVVMLMSSLTSNGTDNLPQAVLPPEPKIQAQDDKLDEPLFEEVEVIEETNPSNDNLDQIAQKLKEESAAEITVVEPVVDTPTKVEKVVPKPEPTKAVVKKETKPTPVAQPVKKSKTPQYYVQVGSFSKYAPDKKFLKSITDKGFNYKYHEVIRNSKTLNKVLVGPFKNEAEARNALKTLRKSIEPGAFLTKI